jgi:hypothetical protein
MYRDSRSETMESAKNYDITNSTDTLVMPFSRTPPEIDPDPVDPDPVEPEPEYPITIELDPAADREIVDIGFNTISLKSGYTLHAWYLNNDEQTGGLSLAGLTPDTYYITVVAVDGNGVPWSNSLEVTVGDPNKEDEITIVIDPIAEKEVIEQYDNTSITLKEGYTLFAWYLDGERQSQTGGSTINLPGLGSGNYKVTVIVTDSNGVPWSNNLTVTVNQ